MHDTPFADHPFTIAAGADALLSVGPATLCGHDPSWPVPDVAECAALMDRYAMPEHIRRHSEQVARIAVCAAEAARDAGIDVDVRSVRASALLHDIAKAYTIEHGGHHAQLGGAWVAADVGNPAIAQGVMHHVFWPFDLDLAACENCLLPLAVIYADKRVTHDAIVSVEDRYEDLFDRYGTTAYFRERIQVTKDQALRIETLFTQRFGVDFSCACF